MIAPVIVDAVRFPLASLSSAAYVFTGSVSRPEAGETDLGRIDGST